MNELPSFASDRSVFAEEIIALPGGDHVGRSSFSGITRSLDLAIAIVSLVFFAPLMLLVAVLVFAESPGPIIYRQMRLGRNGRLFPCFKFRTMMPDGDRVLQELLERCSQSRKEWEQGFKLRVDPRVSRLGSVLRKLSIDELPQLFNVVRGEMAIVGPRPIVVAEIPRYGPFFGDYCSVKPGLTGLWQISGRNNVSYVDRVQLDAEYARKKTVSFDLLIILKTIPAVLLGRGAY